MKLINHNCPVEGEILIEKGKPCNWCEEFDKPKLELVVNEHYIPPTSSRK